MSREYFTARSCLTAQIPTQKRNTNLENYYSKPQKLAQLMDLSLPKIGLEKDGLLGQVEQILQYSVNTWDGGFMSHLYSSTDAPGMAAELVLATLNTNLQ